MNKDLYIEFLESEIRRIRAGANQLYGIVSDCPCPDRDKCDSCGRIQEVQDLKIENDRLNRRNKLMEDYIHAIACVKSKKSKFYGLCADVSCPYYRDKENICRIGSRQLIEQEAVNIIDKLEDL